MNVHELLDIFIVATGTLAVLLTAAILELIRERKEAKKAAREHREEVARLKAIVDVLKRQLHEQRMKYIHK